MALLTKSIASLLLIVGMMMTAGMSVKGQGALTVRCEAASTKVRQTDDLCSIFTAQMARYSGREIVTVKGQANITLVVTRFGPSMISAYIRYAAKAGPEQAMARKGAALDKKAFAQFFVDLLESSPAMSTLKVKP